LLYDSRKVNISNNLVITMHTLINIIYLNLVDVLNKTNRKYILWAYYKAGWPGQFSNKSICLLYRCSQLTHRRYSYWYL